jgi:hypothetical protein
MKKYMPCIPQEALPGSMCERTDGEYYLASDVDARIAELKSALREAMEWNWIDEDMPEEVIATCQKAFDC